MKSLSEIVNHKARKDTSNVKYDQTMISLLVDCQAKGQVSQVQDSHNVHDHGQAIRHNLADKDVSTACTFVDEQWQKYANDAQTAKNKPQ
jgi:hypothetical protein